jgi:hypothetical protein
MRAAYVHVIADALTSMLAIAALVLGSLYGWLWLDPLMGIVGGAHHRAMVLEPDEVGRRRPSRHSTGKRRSSR